MALSDFLTLGSNVPGISPEQQKWLEAQQLLAMGSAMLQAGAPSTDPAHGNLAWGMGQGLAGLLRGRSTGLDQLMEGEKFKALQDQRIKQQSIESALANLPQTENAPPTYQTPTTINPMTGLPEQGQPQPIDTTAQTPRSFVDRLMDAANIYITKGQPHGAAEIAHMASLIKAENGPQVNPLDLAKFQYAIGKDQRDYELSRMRFDAYKNSLDLRNKLANRQVDAQTKTVGHFLVKFYERIANGEKPTQAEWAAFHRAEADYKQADPTLKILAPPPPLPGENSEEAPGGETWKDYLK